jgi:hypothetical protein
LHIFFPLKPYQELVLLKFLISGYLVGTVGYLIVSFLNFFVFASEVEHIFSIYCTSAPLNIQLHIFWPWFNWGACPFTFFGLSYFKLPIFSNFPFNFWTFSAVLFCVLLYRHFWFACKHLFIYGFWLCSVA